MVFIYVILLLPFVAGATCLLSGNRPRLTRSLLLSTAAIHFMLAGLAAWQGIENGFSAYRPGCWFALDIVGCLFLLLTSLLFLVVAIHTVRWFPAEHAQADREGKVNMPENVFTGCMLCFLGTMTAVILAQNFGMLWAAVEATTLASAPMIFFYRSKESLEAMWKYLLICSVGIGLALLGTMFLGVAAGNDNSDGLDMAGLLVANFHPGWFKAAFVCVLAGYGTKMGLAPFHTWLPDAHSESPGNASALLSAALLNCSFLGIWRVYQFAPESVKGFCGNAMIVLGVISLVVAAFFIVHQADFKRMLAYSSVEHMGLIAIMTGWGIDYIGFVHCLGHSLIKMCLFLLAGNILLAYRTRTVSSIRGMYGRLPRTAICWTAGILMICGMPPSPLFFTEYAMISSIGFGLGLLVLILLFIVFAGMTRICLQMCMGPEKLLPEAEDVTPTEGLAWIPGSVFFLVLVATVVLFLGCSVMAPIL